MDFFSLRNYQQECVDNVMKDMEAYNKLLVVLSTGGGKTSIFCEVAKNYLKLNQDKLVLVLSHLSILTNQTHNRFVHDFPDLKVGIMQASISPKEPVDIIISTMQSSRVEEKITDCVNKQKLMSGKADVGLIIIDESHYLPTKSYQTILNYYPNAKVLGVTATPYKAAQLMVNYFDKLSYTISLKELIDMGYLVEPKLFNIEIKAFEEPADRMAKVIEVYKRQEMGKKAVIFLKTIEEAEQMATMFVDHGIKAVSITAKKTGEYRDNILEKFRTGDVLVLTTVNVLTAGFDAPCMEAIFMPYATQSPTTYLQRIGRGLRIFPNKTECRIYCYGDAPSIKKGVYQTVQDQALNVCSKDDKSDIFDELAVLEADGAQHTSDYLWTQTIAEVATRVKNLGYVGLFDLIRRKEFPKRFLRNAEMLYKNMSFEPVQITNRPMTAAQKDKLVNNGFNEEHISKMNFDDASKMIQTINNMRSSPDDPFIVKSGKFIGKHVKTLPYFYTNYVLQKFPNSYISKQIKDYQRGSY